MQNRVIACGIWGLVCMAFSGYAMATPHTSFELLGGPTGIPEFPLRDWMERIAGKNEINGMLVPNGKSSHAPWTNQEFPRGLVGTTLTTPDGARDVWVGYASRAPEQIHAMVCDNEHATCDFFVVTDYVPGKTPKLAPAVRSECTRCHVSGFPLLIESPNSSNGRGSYGGSGSNAYDGLPSKAKTETDATDPTSAWITSLPELAGSTDAYWSENISGTSYWGAWLGIRNHICDGSPKCREFQLMIALTTQRSYSAVVEKNPQLEAYISKVRPEVEARLMANWESVGYAVFYPSPASDIALEPLAPFSVAPTKRGESKPPIVVSAETIFAAVANDSQVIVQDKALLERAKALGANQVLKRLENSTDVADLLKQKGWPRDLVAILAKVLKN